MIVDARTIPAEECVLADVCVIGGGPAGIALARVLSRQRGRVVLLESGDLDMRESSRRLNEVECTGMPYPGLGACRVRALGGTTHVWGGWSRPLDVSDFEARSWIPHSGWPFPRAHLEPFYERAHVLWGLGPCDYRTARWTQGAPSGSQVMTSAFVDETIFQIAPTRFGAAHLPELRTAAGVEVLLHAQAIEVLMHEDATTARGVRVATVAGNCFLVEARAIVVAAGGIENPRLLLASGGQGTQGVGNRYGLVGRFFSDHLHVPVGMLRLGACTEGRRYAQRRVEGTTVRIGWAIDEAVRRERRLLGSAVTLHNADDPHDVLSPGPAAGGYRSLMTIARAIRECRVPDSLVAHLGMVVRHSDEALSLAYHRLRRRPAVRLTIGIRAEQAPNSESRVQLCDGTDRFGMPRLRLQWRMTQQDVDSVAAAQRLLAESLVPGNVDLLPRDGPGGWAERIAPGAHHIGTTRMHRDPCRGVVDENCRVHGTHNLFVAGSSVFPTGGWAPPTLTIVALAVRLADHIGARLPQ